MISNSSKKIKKIKPPKIQGYHNSIQTYIDNPTVSSDNFLTVKENPKYKIKRTKQGPTKIIFLLSLIPLKGDEWHVHGLRHY